MPHPLNQLEDHDQLAGTMVFPANHAEGRRYIENAISRGEVVVPCTSERNSELSDEIPNLVFLPYVHDDGFGEAFKNVLRKHKVGRIYAPVATVYFWLSKFIASHGLTVRLVGNSPIKAEMERHDAVMKLAMSYQSFINCCAESSQGISAFDIAAAFRVSGQIYGESNEQKIAAMIAIFASAPKGDVVEIGSLVGKSASVLTFMARRFEIGKVLAIDPWQSGPAIQNESPDTVRVHMVEQWDYEKMPQSFAVSLLPVGWGILNYLRMESEYGHAFYKKHLNVTTDIFGAIHYTGKVSVIHIDGNHDYSKVSLDCTLWLPLIDSHGWLILDDYVWAHGDGPFRAGNEILVAQADNILRSFVCGKALFIKFGRNGSQD